MSQVKPFETEVQRLLEIVIHSLYSNQEVFLRELVSNASDASEKRRFKQLTQGDGQVAADDLVINIKADNEAKTLTIQDRGIGMTEEELIKNLGTIAHSGTKQLLESIKEQKDKSPEMIGQFGVGFYSAFMVADKVEVLTRSSIEGSTGYRWTSDGVTGYEITEDDNAEIGCTIILHLKEDTQEFSEKARIDELLKRYSNFIGFPIELNEERINQVEAIWLQSKSSLKEEDYQEFYKFIAHTHTDARAYLHFSADAPLSINTLLFLPEENPEQFGMSQMKPGVSLYCKKVLIDAEPANLLPDWLRFLRGVVDCEDLPLNISRETLQDHGLIQKLNKLVTKRVIKFLEKIKKDDIEKYDAFYSSFQRFLKEGIATSFDHKESLIGLMRFETTMTEPGQLSHFAEVIDRQTSEQQEKKKLYYLTGTSRDSVENSPFLEAFKQKGIEVVFFTDAIDEYLLDNIHEYAGCQLISAATGDVEVEADQSKSKLAKAKAEDLVTWLSKSLKDLVGEVNISERLVGSPVAAYPGKDSPTPQIKSMMKAMGQPVPESKVDFEINTSHALIKGLYEVKESNPKLAKLLAKDLLNSALLSADLLEKPQEAATQWQANLHEVIKTVK